MAILVGSEAEGATEREGLAKRSYATKRDCLKSGSVTTLKLKVPATSKSEKWRLAICSDSAGTVGPVLQESAEIAVAKETALTVEAPITAQVVTQGTVYWLCFWPLTAAKVKFT